MPILLRKLTAFICGVIACLPFLTLVFLYLLSWRNAHFIGHWPDGLNCMEDAYNFYAGGEYSACDDPLYQLLHCILGNYEQMGLVPWVIISVPVFPLLLLFATKTDAAIRKHLLIPMYGIGLVALIFDPFQRLLWFLDGTKLPF